MNRKYCVAIILLVTTIVTIATSETTISLSDIHKELDNATSIDLWKSNYHTSLQSRLHKRGGAFAATAAVLGLLTFVSGGFFALIAPFPGAVTFIGATSEVLSVSAGQLMASGASLAAGAAFISGKWGGRTTGQFATLPLGNDYKSIMQSVTEDPLLDLYISNTTDIIDNSGYTIEYDKRFINGSNDFHVIAKTNENGLLDSVEVFNADTNKINNHELTKRAVLDNLAMHTYVWSVNHECGASPGRLLSRARNHLADYIGTNQVVRMCIGLLYKGCNAVILKIYIDSRENMWKAPSNHACSGNAMNYIELYRERVNSDCVGSCMKCGTCRMADSMIIDNYKYISIPSLTDGSQIYITANNTLTGAKCRKCSEPGCTCR
ncbi:hypothetical protein HDU92_004509 [Lobulomyces angularis]|nr:hypothetical protein HDU92_004509 [Lobulomyces angularis]